ncbi:MAG: glycosyltransferase [bacterium]|nr:glycosyltransferase [bacterium]
MNAQPTTPPRVSIVIPFLNEEGTLRELKERIQSTLDQAKISFELIFIDDGSNDGSLALAQTLSREDARVRVFSFRHNCGKAAALQIGFENTFGEFVFTMDADLQDAPEELPGLLSMLLEGNWDLVSGWKQKRHDPISKT